MNAKHPFYRLFVAKASTTPELAATVPSLTSDIAPKPGKNIGGESNLETGSTTWLFSRKTDRDHAREWMLRAAAERGLDVTGII